jgi:choline dehydrogenase-like flavoprotein
VARAKPAREARRPLVRPAALDAEVGIVGAGAAGGVLAFELARRGIRVVVLDSGPRHEFARRPEYVRRYLRRENPWQTSPRELDRHSLGGSAAHRLEGRRVRGIGGSTLHWEGYALRFHANDFRIRSLHGIGGDWPVSYAEIEPYYGAAERALGVAGLDGEGFASPRSSAFPLPPFPLSYSDSLFARACGALGVGLQHLPQARNSVAYGGRPPCTACSTCAVCPTGAKASIDLTHVPQAEATGQADIRPEATAVKIETDPSGRASAVVYRERDGRERRLAARVFVLAGGAVENARLLLLSASRAFPAGLANGSGLVGRFFMSQPSLDVLGRARDKVYPYRIGFSTAMARQFAVERDRATQGAFLLEFLNSAGPTPGDIAVKSGESGDALRRRVQDEFGRWLGIRVYAEHLPDRDNAVSLSPRSRDYFGNPAPHIRCSLGRYERRALDEARDAASQILRTMGLLEIHATTMSFSAHQIGTHRMGRDPRASVVDADLRAHEVPNLYLVGSGCFVTSSALPPTLTIVALAIRAARHIAAGLRPGREGMPGASVGGSSRPAPLIPTAAVRRRRSVPIRGGATAFDRERAVEGGQGSILQTNSSNLPPGAAGILSAK